MHGELVFARLGLGDAPVPCGLRDARVALLGTLRRDGSPRISPIEPYLAEGQLLIGAMAWTGKAGDLRRDPRYVLHSAVNSPDIGRLGTEITPVARRRPSKLAREVTTLDPLAVLGVTWWVERMHWGDDLGRAAPVLRRIEQGPPRI